MTNSNSEAMVALMKSWPPNMLNEFRGLVMARAEEIRRVLKAVGPLEFIKQFYELYDDAVSQDQTLVSCSKGCNFCCRVNVDALPAEALAIEEYCRRHKIDISKQYLKEQLKYGKRELATSSVAKCVFLKDGCCSVYPVRPIACRNYFVVSMPELCDSVKYPSDQGNRVTVKLRLVP